MDDTLENRAYLTDVKIEDVTDCQKCNESHVFALKDKCHSFSIGLSTILSCLKIAEKEGAVPVLPMDWWNSVSRYDIIEVEE